MNGFIRCAICKILEMIERRPLLCYGKNTVGNFIAASSQNQILLNLRDTLSVEMDYSVRKNDRTLENSNYLNVAV